MKLIKPDLQILEQQPGLEGIYKQIELAGRTCYKSEDKITEDSAKAFANRMIASGHGAMLEHGTVYLRIPRTSVITGYNTNKYSKVKYNSTDNFEYITTNLRVLVENNWMDDLKYLCEPTEYHEKRITVKWTCDRVTGESFLRHRVFSFARESTRYCNYSKDKFGNEITFIIPTWVNESEESLNAEFRDTDKDDVSIFIRALKSSEEEYFTLLNNGWQPQQARQVLMFAVHSPLVMTGFESDWKHFFSLRSPKYGAKGMHPDAAYLADKLYDLMYVTKGYGFTLVYNEAFDGKSSYLKDGDMITYHSSYDKNKDTFTVEKVTITPKDGEAYSLTKEEYDELNKQDKLNPSLQSFKAVKLDLNKSTNKKQKMIVEENDIYSVTLPNGDVYYMNKNDYEREKEFRIKKEEEFPKRSK